MHRAVAFITLSLAAALGFGFSIASASRSAAPSKPAWVLDLKEIARLVRLPDRRLAAIFFRSTAGGGPELCARFSTDNGRTWGPTEGLYQLPKDAGGGSPEPLVDSKGELHVFYLKARRKMPSGLDIDIWYTKSTEGRTRWRPVARIWEGYTGSLNSVIQMRSGRIILPFSYMTKRTWAERGEGFDQYTYMGTFNSTVLYSSDYGDTWHVSPSHLKVTAPDLGTYGAIEPVVVERKDGRVWMLLRTQHGRFFESLSEDGITWSTPKPTSILSSDSPAGLTRLDDGRIVMFWNNCLRFPYAYGGRHVMHGAVSSDDGKSWRGFREVAKNPKRHEPPPPRGDHGATYPIPATVNDGKVITTTGLPSPHFNLAVDPAWLYETSQRDDFTNGLDDWTAFGVRGVEVVSHPRKPGAKALSVRKTDSEWPSGAVWNFPSGLRGRLRMRLMLKEGFGGARFGITDHYSVPFDNLEQFHNLHNLAIEPNGGIAPGKRLIPGRWHDIEFNWDAGKRQCRVLLDGRPAITLPQIRETLGANYLRVRSTAETVDNAGLLIESVDANVSPES